MKKARRTRVWEYGIRIIICVVSIFGFTSCVERHIDDGIIISLTDKDTKAWPLGGASNLFVVFDPEVLSVRATREITEKIARSFGMSALALVDSSAFHLLEDDISRQLFVIGRNHSLLSSKDRDALLLFPTGSTPKSAFPTGVVVVSASGSRGHADWRSWSESTQTPFVEARSMRRNDIQEAIKRASRIQIEMRISSTGARRDGSEKK